MNLNRRSFLAGFLACTARCSFGLTLPKVEIEQHPFQIIMDNFIPTKWRPDNYTTIVQEAIFNYQITIPNIDEFMEDLNNG